MYLLMFATSGAPLLVAFIVVAADIDVFYFLSEKYILPDIYNRELLTIIVSSLARFVICYIWLIELGRYISIFLVILVAYMFITKSILQKLQVCNQKCHFLYTQFKLFYVVLREFMDLVTGLLIGCAYTLVLGFAWIVIKCYGRIPLLLYVLFLICLYLTIFSIVVIMPSFAKVHEQTDQLVKKRKLYYFRAGTVAKSKLIQYKIWKAERSVGYRCMLFFDVKFDFFMTFWDHLANDLVTVLLLF